MFYVGETKTELRTRVTVHRQQTRHQDLTLIRANEHFHHCSGGHFKIFPLYKVNTEGDFLRRKETLLFNMGQSPNFGRNSNIFHITNDLNSLHRK